MGKNKSAASEGTVKSVQFEKTANRVSIITIIGNLILLVFKLAAGIFAHSSAMISDAVHSASDVLSTVVVIIGIKLACKEADKEHPYGHERMECVASIILAMLLFITGLGIGKSALEAVLGGNYGQIQVPGMMALIAAIVSIISKEAMYWYTRYHAKRIDSGALMADAWHHRSDALSSVGSLIGIGGAMIGFPVLDPVASVVICLFIIKVSFDVAKDATRKMTDTSCGTDFEKNVYDFVAAQQGVECVNVIHSRMFGNRVYVDIEIEVDGNKSLREAHAVAETVHMGVEQCFDGVKHAMVHVNPARNCRA